MRVLMLNNEYPPLGGGTATVTAELLKLFARNEDLEIDLITSSADKHKHTESFSSKINIFRLPVGTDCLHHASNSSLIIYSIKAFWTAARLYRKNRYDNCFAWCSVPAGVVALALRLLFGLKYLVRVSGPDIPGYEARYNWLYPFLTPIIKMVWRGADKVVAKCEAEANLVKCTSPKLPISIVQNGVDLESFTAPDRSNRNETLRLICVARLIERKGQQVLFEALHKLKEAGVNVVLDLVGTGDALDDYQQSCEKLQITDNVIFSGFVTRDEIPQHLAEADIFVMASEQEGMSVATLEAMAAGLPLLITPCAGTELLLEEGGNGRSFNRGDSDSLASLVQDLAINRSTLNKMGLVSLSKASSFSWEQTATGFNSLLTEINQADKHA